MKLTGEGLEEMKRPEIWVAFFLEYGKGCFCLFFFLTGVEVGDWRVAQRDCRAVYLHFLIWLLRCFSLAIIFSLGDPEGESARVGVMEVRCRCGDALLLASNVTILNNHLGDLCSWLFLKTVE